MSEAEYTSRNHSFIKYLKEKVKDLFPLELTFCEVTDIAVSIGSEDWKFNSDSVWRIIEDDKIIFLDGKHAGVTEYLKRLKVTGFDFLNNNHLDIVIIFENGSRMEFFAQSTLEPWVLHIPEMWFVP